MMQEISLHVLDIANNSIRANAHLIEINIDINTDFDNIIIVIKDNGQGMTEDELNRVIDPFFTTRTTRKIGLGIPFFKQSAEITGGSFSIKSTKNIGTEVKALYVISNIDRPPLGDMNSTIQTLITFNYNIDFIYRYNVNGKSFTLDTREFKTILGDIPFDDAEVYRFIKDYLATNQDEVNNNLPFNI